MFYLIQQYDATIFASLFSFNENNDAKCFHDMQLIRLASLIVYHITQLNHLYSNQRNVNLKTKSLGPCRSRVQCSYV